MLTEFHNPTIFFCGNAVVNEDQFTTMYAYTQEVVPFLMQCIGFFSDYYTLCYLKYITLYHIILCKAYIVYIYEFT